jgi:ribosomal protein L16/L10AE
MRYQMSAEERQRLLQQQLERARLEAIRKEKERTSL